MAAGLGFEPRLTDPLESVSIPSWLFAAVQNMAFSSQIPGSRVSRCSPLFAPVTVKSLSKVQSVEPFVVRGFATVYSTFYRTW